MNLMLESVVWQIRDSVMAEISVSDQEIRGMIFGLKKKKKK
jgi:hypothetical protein